MEARLYDSLFLDGDGDDAESQDFTDSLNPNSLMIPPSSRIEPSVKGAAPGTRFQFERVGYFCVDKDSTAERPVFNRTVQLRDTWAKIEKTQRSAS
jgi:glutaminyl-tRNA synthetase